MGRLAVISIIAAAGLGACAHPVTPVAEAPEMGWSLSHTDLEGAKLAFGQPQTDNVLLMLSCLPRSGQVHVSMSVHEAGAQPPLRLSSQGESVRLAAETGPSGLGGLVVEAQAPAAAPVFDRFARSGALEVAVGPRRTALPPGDPAQASRFVESCRGA